MERRLRNDFVLFAVSVNYDYNVKEEIKESVNG